MPIGGGGGGGGGPVAGSYVPVANQSGVTLDTATYHDPIKGSGAISVLKFPGSQSVLGVAVAGDLFPRLALGIDPTDAFLVLGDGTADPDAGVVVSLTGSGGINFAAPVGAGFNFTRNVTIGAAANPNDATRLSQLSPALTVTSGALPTVQLVTATGAQILTSRDAETITPCTFNPGVATTATVTVALSPDNVTYSTLGVETEPAGTALDGTIHLVKVRVPAGWYLKLTVNAQAVLGLTTYY